MNEEPKYHTFPIILNNTNYVSQSKKFRFTFPQSVYFRDASIALNKVNIYYSWFNISSIKEPLRYQFISIICQR